MYNLHVLQVKGQSMVRTTLENSALIYFQAYVLNYLFSFETEDIFSFLKVVGMFHLLIRNS